MSIRMRTVVLVTALLVAGLTSQFASHADAAAPPTSEGLVPVQGRGLDELAMRPNANFQSYRKVMVEPSRVEFRKGWLRSINSTRGPSRWLVPEDAKTITDNAADSLSAVVTESFRARGYEIVTAPGAGVLQVSARVTDLFINAPDVASAYVQALFNVDAGEATLIMEVRDAETGTLLGRVVDRGTAHELSNRINRAFAVTNLYWFDQLFRQWTMNCIRGFESANVAN